MATTMPESPLVLNYGNRMLRTHPRITHVMLPGRGVYRRDRARPTKWVNDRGHYLWDEAIAGDLALGRAWAMVAPGAVQGEIGRNHD